MVTSSRSSVANCQVFFQLFTQKYPNFFYILSLLHFVLRNGRNKLANYAQNVNETTSVGKFPPNAFGLYDMHGNVWEWCQDDWHDNYEGSPKDGSAWLLGKSFKKVIHGGSWRFFHYYCRSACRDYKSRDFRSNNIGVRVVCVAPRTT